ncbi:MAG: DUF3667 domain-containing protein [Litorimonas sp.]
MGTEDEILLALDEGRGLLDRDDVPNENQSLTCFACDAQMLGLYCHSCGNKNDNYRRSVFSLVIEMIQNITAIDSRMWRSLKSLLLKPGTMSRSYADGARTKWTSPVRFFLATSLLLFGYIAMSGTQLVALGDIREGPSDGQAAIVMEDASETFNQRVLFFVRQSRLKPLPNGTEDIDASRFFMGDLGIDDPEQLEEAIDELSESIEDVDDAITRRALTDTRDALQDRLDAAETPETVLSPDAQNESGQESTESDSDDEDVEDGSGYLDITGFDGQRIRLDQNGINQLYRRILQNPSIINDHLNDNLKWAMFGMMPFAMFMGALFIRGRHRAMLYDHLVHAAYIHAFSFLLLFVFILLGQYTALQGLLGIYVLILLIYLPISAKNMFGRGWFKSVLTAYGVGSVYTLIVFIIAIGILANALQGVALDISETQAVLSSP